MCVEKGQKGRCMERKSEWRRAKRRSRRIDTARVGVSGEGSREGVTVKRPRQKNCEWERERKWRNRHHERK